MWLTYKLKSFGISGLLLTLLESFLKNKFLRVLLNDQRTGWLKIEARVPQSSILDALLFSIYIVDLSDNVSLAVKVFAVKTTLFSVVRDINTNAKELKKCLHIISDRVWTWKMKFNIWSKKTSIWGNILLKKTIKLTHPYVSFNDATFTCSYSQKHLECI